MRASDEDRQRTIDELRRHCAAGRIDVDEYASRIERALAASTLGELDEIRVDLPMLRIAEPGGHTVWAGRGPTTSGRRLRWSETSAPGGSDRVGGPQRVVALALAVVTVMVVLAAILISLVAEWTWAVVLLAGWAAGLVQGRLARAAKRTTRG
jgi:hypothetical protein